jgi:hypothetical protein
MIPKLLLVICSVVGAEAPRPAMGGVRAYHTPPSRAGASEMSPRWEGGQIRGIVVNASDGNRAAGGAEVVLRVKRYGQFLPAAQTTADPRGRFVFGDLLLGEQYEYLPGANHQGVHYPGPRIKLTAERPHAEVELAVRDSVTQPSPLVIRRHEIILQPEPGALRVTESMLVVNPSSKSYVGRPAHEGRQPVTLRLAVPSDFQRLTFHQEFFGRRFSMVDGKLVTSIPWTPGGRELKFTYVLRNSAAHRVWERPLDLPCSRVCVCVRTTRPQQVRSNLPPGPIQRSGELSTVRFESDERTLPAGHVIRIELGELPVPWTVYGRWLALLVLVTLIAGASLVMIGRRRGSNRPSTKAASPARPSSPADSASERGFRRHRRKRSPKRTAASKRAA